MKLHLEKFWPHNRHHLVSAFTIGVLASPSARNIASGLIIFCEDDLETFAGHSRVRVTLLRHMGLIFVLIFDLICFSSFAQ